MIFALIKGYIQTFKKYIYMAIAVGLFSAGWHVNGVIKDLKYNRLTLSYAQAVTKAKEEHQKFYDDRQVLLNEIATAASKEIIVIETEISYVDREIIKYVTDSSTNDCLLDSEWVRLHNYAAVGAEVADTPSRTNATTNEAIGVVTSNYEMYRIAQINLIRLQDWINELTTKKEGT